MEAVRAQNEVQRRTHAYQRHGLQSRHPRPPLAFDADSDTKQNRQANPRQRFENWHVHGMYFPPVGVNRARVCDIYRLGRSNRLVSIKNPAGPNQSQPVRAAATGSAGLGANSPSRTPSSMRLTTATISGADPASCALSTSVTKSLSTPALASTAA